MKVWPFLGGLALLELILLVLWAYSGAIDCDPHCSAYQDGVASAAWLWVPVAILCAAINGVARWRTRRKRG